MNPTNRRPSLAHSLAQKVKQPKQPAPAFKPVVAQLNIAASARSVKCPVAPPVYRPQPVPKVLQTKSSASQSPYAGQTPRSPVAPPVYRPEAKKLVQPKVISPQRKSPTPPPVYRPEQKRVVQSALAMTAPAHTSKASTVYAPQTRAMIAPAGPHLLGKSSQVYSSVLQRKFAPQLRAHASGVVQLEPTDQEKRLFYKRVGEAAPHRFETIGGRELALGVTDYYMLIRPHGGSAYWRRYKLKSTRGGRGFYGRLGDNPPTLAEIAADRNFIEAMESSLTFRQIDFTVAASSGARDNNNQVMGRYLLDGLSPLPASVYARRRDCEWLHMQGHGLGGREDPTNLYAGSHGANSQMAAVETALQRLQELHGDDLTVGVQVITDDDYHSPGVCQQIAAFLQLDPNAVYRAMEGKESRMLEYLEYTVFVRGTRVWTEKILANQDKHFDEAQFNKINERVTYAIQGLHKPVTFVSGGHSFGSGSPPSGGDTGGAASSAMSTN